MSQKLFAIYCHTAQFKAREESCFKHRSPPFLLQMTRGSAEPTQSSAHSPQTIGPCGCTECSLIVCRVSSVARPSKAWPHLLAFCVDILFALNIFVYITYGPMCVTTTVWNNVHQQAHWQQMHQFILLKYGIPRGKARETKGVWKYGKKTVKTDRKSKSQHDRAGHL